MKFWVLGVDGGCAGTEGMKVVRKGNVGTSVADVACLDRVEGRVFVAGIGVEVWRVGGGGVGGGG